MSEGNKVSYKGSYRQVPPPGTYSWWYTNEYTLVCITPSGLQLKQEDLRAGKHSQEFQSCLNSPDGLGPKFLPSAPPVQTAQKIEDGRFVGCLS